MEERNICKYFIGAGNDLHGVKSLEDIMIAKEYLSNIKELTDLPVYKLESIDKSEIVLKLTNEAKIASQIKKESDKRLKEEERQRQLEELKNRAKRWCYDSV